jgi:uncharacterized membrane protein
MDNQQTLEDQQADKDEQVPEKLSNDNLVTLLNTYESIQLGVAQLRATNVQTYLNKILLVLGGGLTIIMTMQDTVYKNIFVILCGILTSILALLLYFVNKRTYRYELEYIARIAKIEDILQFNDVKLYGGNDYWKNDSLMLHRHFKNRSNQVNIKRFVNKYLRKGQLFLIRILSFALELFGVLMIIYGIIRFFA